MRQDGALLRVWLCCLLVQAFAWPFPGVLVHAAADETSFEKLSGDYAQHVRPLLDRYCLECHSTQAQEGELDLERFAGMDSIRAATGVWQKVLEMLDSGQMPPEDAPQLADSQRTRLLEWVRAYLALEARAGAGDPGRVVLRRLSNVEYTNTVRDLTGVELDPAREFPVDGAAGEGFTNVGEALVMSPATLDKYLTAAKSIAAHAVLLPDGFRFSTASTRRDWTDEIVGRIGAFYGQFADSEGRIPLEKYFAATIEFRERFAEDSSAIAAVANERHLSAKYLQSLWDMLQEHDSSLLLEGLRARWKAAKLDDVPQLEADVRSWQKALFRFGSVGHFKPWLQPVDPFVDRQVLRLPLETSSDDGDCVVRFAALDAGDGSAGDFVLLVRPRLEASGRPPLVLRDVGRASVVLPRRVAETLGKTAANLAAAADVHRNPTSATADVAARHGVDPNILGQWLALLGIGESDATQLQGHFTATLTNVAGYAFVNGWGEKETPTLVTNASNNVVNIPGTVPAHAVTVHPSPELSVAVAWQSPLATRVRIEATVADAHAACGNGVRWVLRFHRDQRVETLASGDVDNGGKADIAPIESFPVRKGDVVSLAIDARNRDHVCDLTLIDLRIKDETNAARPWNLSDDIASSVLAGNPHADRQGNACVWHFLHGKTDERPPDSAALVRNSALHSWLEALEDGQRHSELPELARKVQQLLTGEPPSDAGSPDAQLHHSLVSLEGPLFGTLDLTALLHRASDVVDVVPQLALQYGIGEERFGKHPQGQPIDPASMVLSAPEVLDIRIPKSLAHGRELVIEVTLDPVAGREGSVEFTLARGTGDAATSPRAVGPIVTWPDSQARQRLKASYDEFRHWFPAAVCYQRVIPVDEVITLVLFHREDEPLRRLMLADAQTQEIDHLWEELRYVSQDALRIEGAFDQFIGYASQENRVAEFEPLRKPIQDAAESLRRHWIESEPRHVQALVEFASRAWRRPLSAPEQAGLRDLYSNLRRQELDHEDAFRLTLVRVLVAPSFLYRADQPAAGAQQQPVSDWELASRLSYCLWSSMPDAELLRCAEKGELRDPDSLAAQARRMLKDHRVRALGTEFACQWLDIRGFDAHNEKSEQVFPAFNDLRDDMYEESVRFFVDLFQRDGSVLEILGADHAFLNEALAGHYAIPGVTGSQWRRVDGVKAHARGGLLGMASILSKQSGASRTSPVLRGNWVVETLLGEKLPKPPQGVPQLPESEADTEGLTVRQLVEKHRSVAECARCHDRIDPFGFALEGFDAIGRRRDQDLGGRAIDTHVELANDVKFEGMAGLRVYLLTERRDDFLRQFCRKLLGYALGRGLQLSDEPLRDEMLAQLHANDYRFMAALETIVRSKQFRFQRTINDE